MGRIQVRGACPHDCPDTCAIVTEVENGRAVSVRGHTEHPITRGWLCAKVRPYLDHVYHPDRLLYPLRRKGTKGSSQWQRISWNEAFAEIASRWRAIIGHFGAEAILPYSYSGTLGMLQMTVASARLWNRLGASQLERSICGAAAERAVEATIGSRLAPPYDAVLHSRLVIIWGHNPVSTAPHFMPLLRKARHQGCKIVVIDPRRTTTAQTSDWHIAPKPGTDGMLALGIAHLLVRENSHDESWLEQHAIGWPELRARLPKFSPEKVAAETGVTVPELSHLASLYATLRPGLIKIADGINRNRNGGQNVRAICMLPALTGQYGVQGAGLAYSTSGYLQWDRDAVHHWGECPPPGRTVNMNRLGAALLGEVQQPPIMSLFVFGANPAASAPNLGRIVEGLRREDLFTIVHEQFLTDTADYADIVLPSTSQLEHVDLHKAYGHTCLTYNHPAIAPLGECKCNWEVMRLLAGALQFTDPWLHQEPDQVIEEVLTATAANNKALSEITLDRLQKEVTVPLSIQPAVPFADGIFPTPSGKVELYSKQLADAGIDPLPGSFVEEDDGECSWGTGAASRQKRDARRPKFRSPDSDLPCPVSTDSPPLALLTGAAHHFVSSSLAHQPGLVEKEGAPFIEINPHDAEARGIREGDMVVLQNGRGSCCLRAIITHDVRPGVVASPKGRWSKDSGGRNVNWTTSDALGDMAGQSTFHSNRVWVSLAI